jgi:signal transduction histidine kinase
VTGVQTCALPISRDSIEILQEYPDYDPDRMIDIVVSDTGMGIAEENLKQIFDPFFTTKSEDRGTGLGLPIVQNIIHTHGGLVTVESRLRAGTRFHIYLPIAA